MAKLGHLETEHGRPHLAPLSRLAAVKAGRK